MEAQNIDITDEPRPGRMASERVDHVRRFWALVAAIALLVLAGIGFTLWNGNGWQEEQALNTAASSGQASSEDEKGATQDERAPEANGRREKSGVDLFRAPSWQELREQLCQILSREFWE